MKSFRLVFALVAAITVSCATNKSTVNVINSPNAKVTVVQKNTVKKEVKKVKVRQSGLDWRRYPRCGRVECVADRGAFITGRVVVRRVHRVRREHYFAQPMPPPPPWMMERPMGYHVLQPRMCAPPPMHFRQPRCHPGMGSMGGMVGVQFRMGGGHGGRRCH